MGCPQVSSVLVIVKNVLKLTCAGSLKSSRTKYSTYRRTKHNWSASTMLRPSCIASRRFQRMSSTWLMTNSLFRWRTSTRYDGFQFIVLVVLKACTFTACCKEKVSHLDCSFLSNRLEICSEI